MQARGRITLRPKTPLSQPAIDAPILSPSPLEGPIAPAPDDHDHAHAHALAARRVAAAGAAPWGSPAPSSPCPFRGGPRLVRPVRCEPPGPLRGRLCPGGPRPPPSPRRLLCRRRGDQRTLWPARRRLQDSITLSAPRVAVHRGTPASSRRWAGQSACRSKAAPAAPKPPVCPNFSSRHCGQRSCPLPIGTEQPTAWRGRGRGGARGAALAASTSCTPSRARRLSAARAPRARRRAAAPSPFRRTTAESLARLSLRRAAAVALLLVWSTPSRGRRSVELVDAHDARAASR